MDTEVIHMGAGKMAEYLVPAFGKIYAGAYGGWTN